MIEYPPVVVDVVEVMVVVVCSGMTCGRVATVVIIFSLTSRMFASFLTGS